MIGGEPAREPVLELVAQSLSRWGFTAPAVVFLELHQPVAFAAGQLAIFFQPLLGFLIGDHHAQHFSDWLADKDNFAGLIRRLSGGQADSSPSYLVDDPHFAAGVDGRFGRSSDDFSAPAGEGRE